LCRRFRSGAGELRAEQLGWQPMIAPLTDAESVAFDEATLARLLKLTQTKGFT
jgi:hypothetical protein